MWIHINKEFFKMTRNKQCIDYMYVHKWAVPLKMSSQGREEYNTWFEFINILVWSLVPILKYNIM